MKRRFSRPFRPFRSHLAPFRPEQRKSGPPSIATLARRPPTDKRRWLHQSGQGRKKNRKISKKKRSFIFQNFTAIIFLSRTMARKRRFSRPFRPFRSQLAPFTPGCGLVKISSKSAKKVFFSTKNRKIFLVQNFHAIILRAESGHKTPY